MLFLPGEVESAFTRHVVQRMGLDPVQELLRHSLRGNQVVPAPSHVALGIELQDSGGQWVARAKIVEQPAVKPGFPEGLLNGGDVIAVRRHFLCEATTGPVAEPPRRATAPRSEASR